MPVLLFSELKAAAILARDAVVRDWQASSWMYPDVSSHPIQAIGAAIEAESQVAGSSQLFEGDYAAQKESKLQAWERSSGKVIDQWPPQRAQQMLVIFPACVPLGWPRTVIEVRPVKGDWQCVFADPAVCESYPQISG